MIFIRPLDINEVSRIAEIDRSEHVTLNYHSQSGQLEAFPVDWQVPRWNQEGSSGHSVAVRVEKFREMLAGGSLMLGAFEPAAPGGGPDRLAGFAVLRYDLRPRMVELAAMFVSRDYRRQGIAARLLAEAERRSRDSGAESIYVSATPSESAVGFYLQQGFAPLAEPLPEMFELEPEDIHMLKQLL